MTLSTSAVAVCCCSGFAQLVEQPRVLDGDHGLGGEILDQLDLLVGEREHLLPVDADDADQLVVLEHRHETIVRKPPRSVPATTKGHPDGTPRAWWHRESERPAWLCGADKRCFGSGAERLVARFLDRQGVRCEMPPQKCVVLAQIERAEFRSAYIGRIRQYGVEDRLKLARRGTDYLEDVGGGGLLLQRFTQLAEQPRILDRDHRLVGKILTNSICLSVNGLW